MSLYIDPFYAHLVELSSTSQCQLSRMYCFMPKLKALAWSQTHWASVEVARALHDWILLLPFRGTMAKSIAPPIWWIDPPGAAVMTPSPFPPAESPRRNEDDAERGLPACLAASPIVWNCPDTAAFTTAPPDILVPEVLSPYPPMPLS